MFEININVVLKPKEWFEKYAYKDSDGDYWRSYEDYEYYTLKSGWSTLAVRLELIKNNVYIFSTIEGDTPKQKAKGTLLIDWAIDYIPTKVTHPELFV